jgi:hypothetical protein
LADNRDAPFLPNLSIFSKREIHMMGNTFVGKQLMDFPVLSNEIVACFGQWSIRIIHVHPDNLAGVAPLGVENNRVDVGVPSEFGPRASDLRGCVPSDDGRGRITGLPESVRPQDKKEDESP